MKMGLTLRRHKANFPWHGQQSVHPRTAQRAYPGHLFKDGSSFPGMSLTDSYRGGLAEFIGN